MLRGTALAVLLAVLLVGLASPAVAEWEPCPAKPLVHVTDVDNLMLSKLSRRDLSRRLQAYDEKTGHQVFVWIAASPILNPEDAGLPLDRQLRKFAYTCLNAWGIGRKGINDGVLVLFFVADDATWIATGLWAKQRIPNHEAERIHREIIKPLMQAHRYEHAVNAGVDAILTDLGDK